MITYYKTIDNVVTQIDKAEDGCWISVIAPKESEIEFIINNFGLDAGFVRSSLDEEESSRIEIEDEQTLIIVDYAVYDKAVNNTIIYSTTPMGIILTKTNVVTISQKKNNTVLTEMSEGIIKNVNTSHKTRFVLLILLRIAYRFLQFLKQIDKLSNFTEQQLQSMQNKELIQLLDLEKSLVYFSTSLKANQVTLEKILRGRIIRLYEEDQDLLEDVLIEIKQAIEMSTIYSSIISSMMEAVGSIINNNVNTVMKRLTIITIVMAIPGIVFSYYGMNVDGLPFTNSLFPIFISVLGMIIAASVLLNTKNK